MGDFLGQRAAPSDRRRCPRRLLDELHHLDAGARDVRVGAGDIGGSIEQMLAQRSGGSIVSITAALADNPIAGANVSIPMLTKGGMRISAAA